MNLNQTIKDQCERNREALKDFGIPSSMIVDQITQQTAEAVLSAVVEGMKMEGEMGKLTPFQETVNTYIKNRGDDLLTKLTNQE